MLGGCLDGGAPVDRERALAALEAAAGPLEVEAGAVTELLAAGPGARLSRPARDPVEAARRFLAAHHDAMQLTAGEAAELATAQVDVDPFGGLGHVTLQRSVDGIPVFRGAITVHLDAANAVFRVVGDAGYRAGVPGNQRVLTPAQAAAAAARALGAPLDAAREPAVEPRIFQVAPGDDRHAYQVVLAWRGDDGAPRDSLAVVDAEDGALLYQGSLVDRVVDYSGRVFVFTPGAAPAGDPRVVVPFGIDPATSPIGWVDATEKTRGNNAVVATDLNHDNVIGAGEVQPAADPVTKLFDAPYSPLVDASSFKEASVISAFYLVNDFHDRTYGYGFTEASRNCQADNFGRGGTGGDEVQVDTQDGSGLNNAFFTTPPDGMKPRMTLLLFNGPGGIKRDSAFDPTVVYHEAAHALSNRLVGGGTTTCLGGLQSGGMGEGWGDFLAASFLNDPVIGAYVTGNAATGVRLGSMATSTFRYDNIQDGTMAEVHAAGEIWAGALWAARTAIGAPTIERLVVNAMKLMPCNPTMVQGRDALVSVDAVLTGGTNRCALFAAFAGRGLGNGAASPNHNSTTAIVTSTTVPADCGGTSINRTFRSATPPIAIPDNSAVGVNATIFVAPAGLTVGHIKIDVKITHPSRGNLIVQVVSPGGTTVTLSNLAGGTLDDFVRTAFDITASLPAGSAASGNWRLFVRDLVAGDVGTINTFRVSVTTP